jgi:hypothetical protein
VPLPSAFEPPTLAPPHRVLVLLAATSGWYDATTERREHALDSLRRLFAQAEARGARLVGSFDDDLFVTGQPASLPYSIYVLYDVDDLRVVVELVHELRASELAAMFRLEARIGRPLFLLAG